MREPASGVLLSPRKSAVNMPENASSSSADLYFATRAGTSARSVRARAVRAVRLSIFATIRFSLGERRNWDYGCSDFATIKLDLICRTRLHIFNFILNIRRFYEVKQICRIDIPVSPNDGDVAVNDSALIVGEASKERRSPNGACPR